jgi:hypothetical protein
MITVKNLRVHNSAYQRQSSVEERKIVEVKLASTRYPKSMDVGSRALRVYPTPGSGTGWVSYFTGRVG